MGTHPRIAKFKKTWERKLERKPEDLLQADCLEEFPWNNSRRERKHI
jgi:hypothetical protein